MEDGIDELFIPGRIGKRFWYFSARGRFGYWRMAFNKCVVVFASLVIGWNIALADVKAKAPDFKNLSCEDRVCFPSNLIPYSDFVAQNLEEDWVKSSMEVGSGDTFSSGAIVEPSGYKTDYAANDSSGKGGDDGEVFTVQIFLLTLVAMPVARVAPISDSVIGGMLTSKCTIT